MIIRATFVDKLKRKMRGYKKEYIQLLNTEPVDIWLGDIEEVEKLLDKYVPCLPQT